MVKTNDLILKIKSYSSFKMLFFFLNASQDMGLVYIKYAV